MAIAYIISVFVLIHGFKAEALLQTTVFACVNAGTGFVIMQFLKVQGEAFAKMLPENKEIIDRYYKTKTKDKKVHSMRYFWITSVAKDVLVKCLTLGATTIGLIYIVIQGSNDYNMLLLAIVNLLMFICFGFLSLVNAYDFFNQKHVPYMVEQLKNEKAKETKEAEQDSGELQPEADGMESEDQARAEETEKVL
ncbi:MAG: hypothetical protein IIX06_04550 [Bacteroidales bacterium]|nr:hypothetical protein [Bacteroidales bacterium]